MAKPYGVEILIEAAAKADREKVDWPERVNVQDYPQIDVRKWPTTLEISINSQRVARLDLPDDPADARGVLSHLARVGHGSYEELLMIKTPLPGSAKADLAAGRPLILRFTVPEDAEHPGGLCLFSAETGAYPVEPTLTFETEAALPENLGVKATSRSRSIRPRPAGSSCSIPATPTKRNPPPGTTLLTIPARDESNPVLTTKPGSAARSALASRTPRPSKSAPPGPRQRFGCGRPPTCPNLAPATH